jgi:hypothetical protein
MKIKQKIYFLVFTICSLSGYAQQLPRFSQYYSNEFLVNPSVAGYDGRTINRGPKQWMDLQIIQLLSISLQGRILKSSYSLKPGSRGNVYRKGKQRQVGLYSLS